MTVRSLFGRLPTGRLHGSAPAARILRSAGVPAAAAYLVVPTACSASLPFGGEASGPGDGGGAAAGAAAAGPQGTPATESAPDAAASPLVGPVPAAVADPVRVTIARLGVEAPVIPLDLRPDGSIEVPEGPDDTGWWWDGPEPGEVGPAVI